MNITHIIAKAIIGGLSAGTIVLAGLGLAAGSANAAPAHVTGDGSVRVTNTGVSSAGDGSVRVTNTGSIAGCDGSVRVATPTATR